MTAREDELTDPKISRLLDHADKLLVGVVSTVRVRENVARARRAYGRWRAATQAEEARHWLHVMGSRALAAALEVHVGFVEAKRSGATPSAMSTTLAATLLEVSSRTIEAPSPGPGGSADEGFVAGQTTAAPAPAPAQLHAIETCARIAASVARRRADKDLILERNQLTDDAWNELDQHWAEAVKEDIKQGKNMLLVSYDDAYVAQLEDERGPISVEEYARLVVAAERGVEQQVLAELDLPRGATARIKRVWLRKTMQDKALARKVREALDG